MKLLTSTEICRRTKMARGRFGYRALKLGLKPVRQEIRNGRTVSLWDSSVLRKIRGAGAPATA